ncbi:general transcription factor II-I repeat domain-containing protein 2B-like [Watersipora subatra]|uniref:general transcription factor II-I repeat domain-containing protein 2B-like n=1 Tax=Watersipora subatra TaxID=2589382 RepID=UPI00355BF6F2
MRLKFLQESDSQYDDLLVHNNVRWLSKGIALQRVWTVRQHIEQAFSEIGGDAAERFLEILRSEHSLRDMAFLTDILAYLNDLNLKLQGEGRNVVELWQAVTSFKDKLHCFYEDINSDMNHFPIIREFENGRDDVVDLTAACAFLIDVSSEMERRFAAFDSINGIIELVACPFQAHQLWKTQVDNFPHVPRGVAELELCDLKADILAKAQFAEQTIVGFRTQPAVQEKYPMLCKMAVHLPTFFGTTYLCESMFSKLTFIKSRYRSVLTEEHTQKLLSVAVTKDKPDIAAIAAKQTCFHVSH